MVADAARNGKRLRQSMILAAPSRIEKNAEARMFPQCPKCAHPLTGRSDAERCPACGLVFSKYVAAQLGREAGAPVDVASADTGRAGIRAALLHVPDEVESWRLAANAGLLAASILLGWRYYVMDMPSWAMAETFLHTAMVPFHEFGHLLFRPFGEFMTVLGGSLAQWLMPIGFLVLFLRRNRDPFTASLMLWWMGTQWIDLAPYAWDALVPQHVLLTGRTGDTGAHDYIDILGDLGLLKQAHAVARVMHEFGLAAMLAAWAWAGYLLSLQFKQRAR